MTPGAPAPGVFHSGGRLLLYGWVGEVAIYRRALTGGQIQALYEASKQEYPQ